MADWIFAIGVLLFGVAMLSLLVLVIGMMWWALYRLLFGRDDS